MTSRKAIFKIGLTTTLFSKKIHYFHVQMKIYRLTSIFHVFFSCFYSFSIIFAKNPSFWKNLTHSHIVFFF